MYTIKADDARQSAIFWMLGHFYEWNLEKIAETFKVPFGVIILELRDMGFQEKTIISLQHNDHPTGFCRVCKLETHKKDEEYCCDTCRKRGKTIKSLLRYGYVPTTWSRHILYNLNNHTVYKIVQEK